MAEFSQNELKAIESHPLREELKYFRTTFRSRYLKSESVNVTDTVHQLTSQAPDEGVKNVILDLILALLSQPAARILNSQTGAGPLSGDIATFYGRLASNPKQAKHVAPLLRLVLTEAKDAKIWTAVFDLVAQNRVSLQPTTPPPSHPSFTSSFQQTPWAFNTGGFEDTSEYRKQVDEPLKEELLPSLRIDIPDFVQAVFDCVPELNDLSETVFTLCQEEEQPLYKEGSGWIRWPPTAKEEEVLEWLQEVTTRLTGWVHERGIRTTISRQIYRGPGVHIDGTPIKRKMDVGFIAGNGQRRNEDGNHDDETEPPKPNWSQILVTGELKSNPVIDGQEKAWVDLATYAREVFRTQDRRFVLGFTLCGSKMRLWHFDRSGACGSSSFDINHDGLAFIQVMLGCYLMTDEQLGLDPTIQGPEGQRYVKITRNGQVERLVLTKLIKRHVAIVGRATSCWRAYCVADKAKKPLIVKDSWQYEERPEEGLLIQEATNKEVDRIARYYHHETVRVGGEIDDTLGNVRRGLMKACGRTTFRQKASKKLGVPASESRGRTMASQMQTPPLLRKRSSSSAQLGQQSSTKRSRSSFRLKDSAKPLHNRVHRRVITRDAGKHIYEASSLKAILNGILGAVQGHESLVKAGILHRDISIGNIMLTENEDDGFLIDLDLAIRTGDDHASGAPSKTGTKVFMPIGGLLGEPHKSVHDQESFFWVFFWICIHHNGFGRDGTVRRRIFPEYEDWNYLSTEKLAREKAGQISKGIFDHVDEKFTEYCKPFIPCLKQLHELIFPGGSRRFTEHQELYSDMKKILEEARDSV